MKVYIFILLLLFCSILRAEKQILVPVFDNYPNIFTNKDGKADGIFIELIKEIAKRENWQLNFVPMSFNEALNKARENKSVLLCGLQHTFERSQFLEYNKVPVLISWSSLSIKANSKINDIIDLQDKPIGIVKSVVSITKLLDTLNTLRIKPKIIYLDNFNEVLDLLKKNKIIGTILIHKNKEINEIEGISLKSLISFKPGFSYYAFSKEDAREYLPKIDKYLSEWKIDEESIYYKTLNKWLINDNKDNFLIIIIGIILLLTVIYFILKRMNKSNSNK
jgi:ABC-type amino acid transport substrate-binding protein